MPEPQTIEEIWVSVTEGAQITGYNRDYLLQVTSKAYRLPDEQRFMRVRKRTLGFEIWLPDLVAYIETIGNGPQVKNPQPEDT